MRIHTEGIGREMKHNRIKHMFVIARGSTEDQAWRRRVMGSMIACLLLSATDVQAQPSATQVPSISVDGSASYRLEAKNVDETYLIEVTRVGQLSADEKYAVVYALDGNVFHPLVSRIATILNGFGDSVPPLLVVSIGYVPDDASLSVVENFRSDYTFARVRDFTHAVNEEFLATAPPNAPENFSIGGAGNFLAFLDEELKPFIGRLYPTDANDQTLIGHSFGGLFVFYALFNSPSSFQRYIASSPSLSYDGRSIFEDEIALADTIDDLNANLFISVGSLERDEMIGNATAMASRLRGREYENLDLEFQIFPEEDHESVTPVAVTRGLREVFK